MKKSFTIIYSILVSIVLIFSITFFAVNLYNENAHGELRTQLRFEKVVTGVRNTFEKNNISSSEKIRQIENTIGDTKDFAYIKIIVDNKPLYVFPEDYDENEANTSKLIIPRDRYFTANGSSITIKSGLYSIRPNTIFEYAKISFFIILIIALLTIILIIYNNHFDKDSGKKAKAANKEKKEKFIDEDDDDLEDTFDSEEYVNEDDENEQSENTEESEDNTDEPFEPIDTNDEIIDEPISEPVKKEELPVQDFEPVEIKEEKPVSENGLFSPDTGLGWESYLKTRLDNELNRATASELDLALFNIKIDGIGRKNPVMKKICEYLTVEFQFKDLLFEYKDDSICGIKISMDIDNAVSFAEKLVNEIKNIAKDESPVVLVGVTTRGIRMVSGERLLKEADEAVKHAAEDINNPVVGFRADAVKYRKFLEKN